MRERGEYKMKTRITLVTSLNGALTDEQGAPLFKSRSAGDVLVIPEEYYGTYTETKDITVLCVRKENNNAEWLEASIGTFVSEGLVNVIPNVEMYEALIASNIKFDNVVVEVRHENVAEYKGYLPVASIGRMTRQYKDLQAYKANANLSVLSFTHGEALEDYQPEKYDFSDSSLGVVDALNYAFILEGISAVCTPTVSDRVAFINDLTAVTVRYVVRGQDFKIVKGTEILYNYEPTTYPSSIPTDEIVEKVLQAINTEWKTKRGGVK